MSIEHPCGDTVLLAGYVYEDGDPAELRAMAAHVRSCALCTEEVRTLRSIRGHLAAWSPPDTRLGFTIVPQSTVTTAMAPPPRDRWSWSGVPSWAQAAAAVMLFASGVALAALMNLEVRYDQAGGMTIRTGWQQAAVPAKTTPVPDHGDIEQLARRVFQQERGALTVAPSAATAQPRDGSAGAASGQDVLRRVEGMLAASEQRQQRELAMRIGQVIRDIDSQHRADIDRIDQIVSPMKGLTTEDVRLQKRYLDYLMNVSQTR